MSNQFIKKVTGVTRVWSTTGGVELVKLECGHTTGRPETETDYICDCGKVHTGSIKNPLPKCDCGSFGLRVGATRTLSLPAEAHCKDCETEAAELAKIPEYVAASVHSRYRAWGGGIITFYGRSESSPTGVLAIATVSATKAAEALIRKLNSSISPLSPTEGLCRGLQ